MTTTAVLMSWVLALSCCWMAGCTVDTSVEPSETEEIGSAEQAQVGANPVERREQPGRYCRDRFSVRPDMSPRHRPPRGTRRRCDHNL